MRSIEVRPQRIGEVELGVRQVPQQKVADPPFASGANEEIRFRQVVEREFRLHHLLVDIFECQFPSLHAPGHAARSLAAVPAPP